MKSVTVRYYNVLRDLAGRQEETKDLSDDATVADLLRLLADSHGRPMRRLLLAVDGAKSPYLSLFVNQKRVQGTGTDAVLGDGDVVMVLPAIAGGYS